MGDTRTDGGKGFTKGNHAAIFGFVTDFAPARVVAVLFTPFGITSCCLDVTIWPGTDPYISPGRRYTNRFNALQYFLVTNQLAIETNIAEVFANRLTPDARVSVTDVAQARYLSYYARIDNFFTWRGNLF